MRHLTVQQISASLDGALAGVSLELVVRHLSSCGECRDRHARLSKQDDALRRLLAWEPDELWHADAAVRLETMLQAEVRGVPAPPQSHPPEWNLAVLPLVTASHEPGGPGEAGSRADDQALASFESLIRELATKRKPVPEPRAIEDDDEDMPGASIEMLLSSAPLRVPEPAPVSVAPVVLEPVERAVAEVPHDVPAAVPARERRAIRVPRSAVFAGAALAALLVGWWGLVSLPPVIRVAVPQLPAPRLPRLPRLPRIELVRGAHRDVRPPALPPQAIARSIPVEQAPPASAAPVVTGAPVPEAALVPAPTPASAPAPRIEPPAHPAGRVVRTSPPPAAAALPLAAAPAAHDIVTTSSPAPAPVAIAPTPSAPAPVAPPVTTGTAADDAATWPLFCGGVTDDAGAPVVGARVLLADLDLGARTDRRGHFCLAAPPGDRTLSVVAMGFAPYRQTVSLGAQTQEIAVHLKAAP